MRSVFMLMLLLLVITIESASAQESDLLNISEFLKALPESSAPTSGVTTGDVVKIINSLNTNCKATAGGQHIIFETPKGKIGMSTEDFHILLGRLSDEEGDLEFSRNNFYLEAYDALSDGIGLDATLKVSEDGQVVSSNYLSISGFVVDYWNRTSGQIMSVECK
jgi:hypothetical protein